MHGDARRRAATASAGRARRAAWRRCGWAGARWAGGRVGVVGGVGVAYQRPPPPLVEEVR